MRVIGLTGGIASGKSSVARLIEDYGIPVIDADQLAREAVQPGSEALRAIALEFGAGVLGASGVLDRAALAEIVFADPIARQKLEMILHPAIRQLAEKRLSELRNGGAAVVFYMAPLLIEAGVADRVDEIWVVSVDEVTQLERLMARDGIPLQGAQQRLAAQMPLADKRRYGSVVIENNGTPEELALQVVELCRRLLGA
jgi:dephospho-CoA kinase